jgi:hypothetical protein
MKKIVKQYHNKIYYPNENPTNDGGRDEWESNERRHLLDDFFFVGKANTNDCFKALQTLLCLADILGVPRSNHCKEVEQLSKSWHEEDAPIGKAVS